VTPINKNVTVTDEFGNEYEPTYAKRARGLVRKGRARFVGENRICLTRPPSTIMEDDSMNNEYTALVESTATAANPADGDLGRGNTVTTAEILRRIDRIIEDKAHIDNALHMLQNVPSSTGSGSPAWAIGSIVEKREQTNQRMLALLERMYNDISPRKSEKTMYQIAAEGFEHIVETLGNTGMDWDIGSGVLEDVAKAMFANIPQEKMTL